MRHKTRDERPIEAVWESYGFCSYFRITYSDGFTECVDYATHELSAVSKGITDEEEKAHSAREFWKYRGGPVPTEKPTKYTWGMPDWQRVIGNWDYRPGGPKA